MAAIPFVVVTTQRSGSTLLVQALQSHPQVRCYQEMLGVGNRNPQSYRVFLRESRRRRVMRWIRPVGVTGAYLERLFASDPSATAIGFKLMYNHLRRHPELLWLFRRSEVKVVHLVRNNVLKTHVSALAARERRLFQSREQVDVGRIRVPTNGLVTGLDRRVRSIERHRRRLGHLHTLEVSYEGFVADREREGERILRFLGVDPTVALKTRIVKLNPDELESVVLNYPALVEHLTGTPYETLLQS